MDAGFPMYLWILLGIGILIGFPLAALYTYKQRGRRRTEADKAATRERWGQTEVH
ncbi:MAG TPA: hypothetical protein VIL65_02640 [Beijerinckiaceae bacterium]|jgi:hypothetical protein